MRDEILTKINNWLNDKEADLYVCTEVLRELIDCNGNTIRYFDLFRKNLYFLAEGNETDIKHLENLTTFIFFNHKKFYDAYIQDFIYLFSYLYAQHKISADEKEDFINKIFPGCFDFIEKNIRSLNTALSILYHLEISEI